MSETKIERMHPVVIFWSDDDDCYVADLPDLAHCSAFGDTPEEALREVQVARSLWLEVAAEKGLPIPERSVWSPSQKTWVPRTGSTAPTSEP